MSFEYKTVGAPEQGKRRKGARTHSDRAAVAFEEILQAEAVDGWEYLRTDILPVTERRGWFGGTREAHRAVMVFRRPVGSQASGETVQPPSLSEREAPLRAAPKPDPDQLRFGRREPGVRSDPDLRLAEIVRGPGQKPTEGE